MQKIFTPILSRYFFFAPTFGLIKLVELVASIQSIYVIDFNVISFTFRFCSQQTKETTTKMKNNVFGCGCSTQCVSWCELVNGDDDVFVVPLLLLLFFSFSHTILILLCVLFWFRECDNLCRMLSNAQFASNLATKWAKPMH